MFIELTEVVNTGKTKTWTNVARIKSFFTNAEGKTFIYFDDSENEFIQVEENANQIAESIDKQTQSVEEYKASIIGYHLAVALNRQS